MDLLYNLFTWICCRLSTSCGLVEQLVVQHGVQDVSSRSTQVEFGPDSAGKRQAVNAVDCGRSSHFRFVRRRRGAKSLNWMLNN